MTRLIRVIVETHTRTDKVIFITSTIVQLMGVCLLFVACIEETP